MAKYSIDKRLIWLNGKIVHVEEAVINVLSPTSQFGLNVFEGIRCFWNESEKKLYAFRLEAHYSRLIRSAKILQINCPYSVDDLKMALINVVQANEYREDISVRQTIFIEGFGSWSSESPVGMFVAPIPKQGISAEYNKKGLNCCISSWERINENSLSPRIKCGANYINSRLAQLEALRNGYDTTILLNNRGKVSEGPGSCLFMVQGNKLTTPRITDSVLESITRETVMIIAKSIGYKVEEREIDRTELYTCDEAFLCGSAMGITPINSVDKFSINSGITGNITNTILDQYRKIVIGEVVINEEWLTSIY